ncbi:hypothetical protein HDA32_003081 [Spinactinospora alkalitolerans]|uniref:Permease n=1 Tax=Spinactinospora alkalitolerans TaxID=687207 RepID=A0A852TW57_9ACTN|nr:permease [Spinactinospora alkalitolerans]NYE47961.1 hypothetical protein [Spinactinospora alkalitolerans]
MELTPAHWIYLGGIATVIALVVAKKNIVAPAIIATFLTALAFSGSVLTGLQAIFSAFLTAATELFTIFMIIAIVLALLRTLQTLGADQLMVRPFQGLMRTGAAAYIVLAAVTFGLSSVFWPTPMLPLIAAILIPAALRVGLSPLGCAIAIAIAGQGMALSTDYIMGVAPGLSASGAGVDAARIADRALLIAVITGVVALSLSYLMYIRRDLRAVAASDAGWIALRPRSRPAAGAARAAATGDGDTSSHTADFAGADTEAVESQDGQPPPGRRAQFLAVLVPGCFGVLLAYLLLGKLTSLVPPVDSGLGAPLVGGTAGVLLLVSALISDRREWLEVCADNFVSGISEAFRMMGVVIPVAGFVFIGLSDFSGPILGLDEGAQGPAFLLDAVMSVQGYIPQSPFFVLFAMLIIGMLVGLDGSGWPALPFTGTLASALGPEVGLDVATLAAVAQNGSTWTGGGTLVVWSSLVAVAAVTNVSVIDLARKLFLPVVTGLVVATALVGGLS